MLTIIWIHVRRFQSLARGLFMVLILSNTFSFMFVCELISCDSKCLITFNLNQIFVDFFVVFFLVFCHYSLLTFTDVLPSIKLAFFIYIILQFPALKC